MIRSKTGHIVGWLLLSALVLTFVNRDLGLNLAKMISIVPAFLLFIGIYMAVFYVNTGWLLPKFFFRRRYWVYTCVSVFILVSLYFISPFENLIMQQVGPLRPADGMMPFPDGPETARPPFPGHGRRPPQGHPGAKIDIISLVLWGMVWAIGMFTATTQRWQKTRQAMLKSEADKAKAELAFLKAQINPHFLFNTLSNLYVLALSKSEDTAPGILKLSNLMRYLVEESTFDSVPLTREVEFIENYIELQKLRLNERTLIKFTVSGVITEARIAPMILITFIENAFKYGVSANREVTIKIELTLEKEFLTLYCQNKIVPYSGITESTGIGIRNTKNRLEHAYPNRHWLDIASSGDDFRVQLKVDISTPEVQE